MIEAIVDHFQKAGFTVRIYLHVLCISKPGYEDLQVDWRIDDIELTYPSALPGLIDIADRYMLMLDKAIEKRGRGIA